MVCDVNFHTRDYSFSTSHPSKDFKETDDNNYRMSIVGDSYSKLVTCVDEGSVFGACKAVLRT
jgi:hypothetical protein